MRTLLIVAVAGCGGAGPPHAPPPSGKTVIETFVDGATLIVRGRVHVDATDDASVGTIQVDELLKGTSSPTIHFISDPISTVPEEDAILFLRPAGADRWRLQLTGPGYAGLAITEQPSVIAAIHRP